MAPTIFIIPETHPKLEYRFHSEYSVLQLVLLGSGGGDGGVVVVGIFKLLLVRLRSLLLDFS